jgi:hypothetical protein
MLHDLRNVAPWMGIFMLSLLVAVSVTRTARHCLFHRELNIKAGIVHRVAASFWGLYCERPRPSLPVAPAKRLSSDERLLFKPNV